MVLVLLSFILLLSFAAALYNYFTAPEFSAVKSISEEDPLVSVILPARDEEDNIQQCLEALSGQDYSSLEILAGNDNSTDKTEEIIDRFAEDISFIKKINIPELPYGWTGKNFAADTLYRSAKGDLILFMDADVILDKNAVSAAVDTMRRSGAAVLSVFPSQIMLSFGEKLVVPLLNFFLLSLLPLLSVFNSGKVSLSAGIGQFIFFKREAYEKTGGHSRFRNKIAEDLELIREAKRNKIRVLALIDKGLVKCRMYRNLPDAVNGFTKNFFRGSALNSGNFVIFTTIYFLVYFLPFILIFFNPLFIFPMVLIILIRLTISLKSRQPLFAVLLHPLQIVLLYITGIRSVIKKNGMKWKGRIA